MREREKDKMTEKENQREKDRLLEREIQNDRKREFEREGQTSSPAYVCWYTSQGLLHGTYIKL